MVNAEVLCKHGKIPRNCYSCHVEFIPQEKSEMDALHETISELKIRVSKLEEYKRLQDDINKKDQYFLELSHELYTKLEEHRKKQIDENRTVSKHLSQLDQDNAELNSRQNDLTTDIEMLCEIAERLGVLEIEMVNIKIYSHSMQEKVWQENISKRIEKLEDANPIKDIYNKLKDLEEKQRFDKDRITHHNEWLLEHDKLKSRLESHDDKINILLLKLNNLENAFKEATQDFESPTKDDFVKFDPGVLIPTDMDYANTGTIPKTTGLTFEEAITAFKAGKTIAWYISDTPMAIYEPKIGLGYGFEHDHIHSNHWGIVE